MPCYRLRGVKRPWHIRAAALALLALALQIALPLWHAPARAGTWICTAQGLMQVPVDADGLPALPDRPKIAKSCPICALAQAGGAAILPPAMSSVVGLAATDRPRPPVASATVPMAAPPPATRGPPAA